MLNSYEHHAKIHGKTSTVRLGMTVEDHDKETLRQANILFPLLREHLTGSETDILDFGCGAGRFTPYLQRLLNSNVVGYDPSASMINFAPKIQGVTWNCDPPEKFFIDHKNMFDVAFVFGVMGCPDLDPIYTVEKLVETIKHNGIVYLVDHMTDTQPAGKWWRFRTKDFYADLFAKHGVSLAKIGEDWQLENPITIMAGKKS